jgi:hypothetical protein
MNEHQRKTREDAINAIKKIWGLGDIYDAFPTSIKPPNLGNTGMSYLKSIAMRVPNKEAAQRRMLDECTNSKGKHVPCGQSILSRILRSLMQSGHSAAVPTDTKSNASTKSTAPAVVKRKLFSKTGAEVSRFLNLGYNLF